MTPVYSPDFGRVNATSSRFYILKLVFCMPVNIQLSKISIASTIG
jgi:hypothetical protein